MDFCKNMRIISNDYMRSEIFDKYAKLMEENGLISLSEDEVIQPEEPKESPKLRKYKKSPHPRAGSDDIETIEALYGVKPDNSIKYDYNIMEAAHPKPVVIAPSYDRLNALVENNNERHNIICNIVMKPNDGISNYRKYAKQELLMELIRVANDMDNFGHDELRKLADNCIDEISVKKKFEKTAIIWWIAAGAVALAGLWFWSHTNDVDKGLIQNIENSINELNDLKTNSWYESDVDETVQRDVDIIIHYLNNLQGYATNFNSIMDQIYKPISLEDRTDLMKFKYSIENNGEKVNDKIQEFIKVIDYTIPQIIKSINNFSSNYYQKQHTKPSLISDISGWIGEGLHGRWGLIANDFVSAVNALNTLKDSLLETRKLATNFDRVRESKQEELENQVVAFRQQSSKVELPNEEAPQASNQDNKQVEEQDETYTDIARFLGHKPTSKEISFFRSLK